MAASLGMQDRQRIHVLKCADAYLAMMFGAGFLLRFECSGWSTRGRSEGGFGLTRCGLNCPAGNERRGSGERADEKHLEAAPPRRLPRNNRA